MPLFNNKSSQNQLISLVLMKTLSLNHAFTPLVTTMITGHISDPISPLKLLEESTEYLHPLSNTIGDRLSMNLISILHTGFDIGLSVVSPEGTFFIRLLGILGRSIGLARSCYSSQGIMAEELLLQSTMIMVSLALLFKSLLPIAKAIMHSASNSETSPGYHREVNAYKALFEPIGLSWLQYNTLNASEVFEWIKIDPYQDILLSNSKKESSEIKTNFRYLLNKALEKDIYWLHSGSIEVLFDKKYGRKMEKPDNFDFSENENINDIVFATNVFWTKCNTTNDSISFAPEKRIKGGSSGAELLKVNSEKLLCLMENDGKLSSCIETLFFIGACNELSHLSTESHDCYIDEEALEKECKIFV